MNNRDYKQFAKGTTHHIYNRGVGKINIFLDNEDKAVYISLLRENIFPKHESLGSLHGHHRDGDHGGTGDDLVAERHTPYIRKTLPSGSFSLLGYCLMPNHFHLIIRQLDDTPAGELISRVSNSYSKYFNKKYNRVGSLYQDTFKAALIDSDSYLLWLSAYVHNNPKISGLVDELDDYHWSSYPDYIGKRNGTLCDRSFILKMFNNDARAYQKFVEESFYKIKEHKELDILLLD